MSRHHSMGIVASLIATGLAGTGYISRVRDEEVLIIDERKSLPPIAKVKHAAREPQAADAARIEAAQRRRARKIERQAKGFRA